MYRPVGADVDAERKRHGDHDRDENEELEVEIVEKDSQREDPGSHMGKERDVKIRDGAENIELGDVSYRNVALQNQELDGPDALPSDEGVGAENALPVANGESPVPPVNLEDALRRDIMPEVRLYFAYAWRMYCSNCGTLAGITMLWLIYCIISTNIANLLANLAAGKHNTFLLIFFDMIIGYPLIAFVFFPGLCSTYLALHEGLGEGQIILSSNCFKCFVNWARYRQSILVGTVLYFGAYMTWLMLVIPCIVFTGFQMFTIPIYLEHPQVGLIGAMQASHRLVWKHASSLLSSYAGFFIFNFFLLVFQVAIFRVLTLVAIPLGISTFVYCYHHLIGVNGIRRDLYFIDYEEERDVTANDGR